MIKQDKLWSLLLIDIEISIVNATQSWTRFFDQDSSTRSSNINHVTWEWNDSKQISIFGIKKPSSW